MRVDLAIGMGGDFLQLQLATWQRVERYLQTSTGIVLAVGLAEQHGPNGLIGTDAICPK